MTVKDAISISCWEDRIVRIRVDDISAVLPYVEEAVETPDGIDCWGEDEDGDDFRLLVTVAVAPRG
jgi:hypothetical protein